MPKPTKPGCIEVDLVEHNAGDPSGQYLYTLTAVDRTTNIVIRLCLPNKSANSVHKALKKVVELFPAVIFWIDSDNGSEFINKLVIGWANLGLAEKRLKLLLMLILEGFYAFKCKGFNPNMSKVLHM